MKRRGGRKSQKKEEGNSNGVEDQVEQNGEAAADEDEAPKDKKRKSSKSGGKRKDEAVSTETEQSGEESEVEVKEKKRSSRKSKKPSKIPIEEQPEADEVEESESEKKKSNKKGKKSPKAPSDADQEEDQDEDDESQYEVESILDEKMIGGVRHYLIRWKGYEEESDTWEPEDTLECADLIAEYKERKKKGKAEKGKKSSKKDKKEPKLVDWDENEDFEVERILEVHHKRDGKREFLVSWKGFTHADNSWEPEENMDCKDLINRFMAKVQKAREVDEKELRVNRKQVQRYTLSMQERSRRLSKRFSGRERVQYHDAE